MSERACGCVTEVSADDSDDMSMKRVLWIFKKKLHHQANEVHFGKVRSRTDQDVWNGVVCQCPEVRLSSQRSISGRSLVK